MGTAACGLRLYRVFSQLLLKMIGLKPNQEYNEGRKPLLFATYIEVNGVTFGVD